MPKFSQNCSRIDSNVIRYALVYTVVIVQKQIELRVVNRRMANTAEVFKFDRTACFLGVGINGIKGETKNKLVYKKAHAQ